jgi:hypothetical protein
MTQNEVILKTDFAASGKAIDHPTAIKMIRNYQDANPSNFSHGVGKNIIMQILDQPGCVGIRTFNGYDETGKHTLIITGMNADGDCIIEYTVMDPAGQLSKEKGIVADKVPAFPPGGPSYDGTLIEWPFSY